MSDESSGLPANVVAMVQHHLDHIVKVRFALVVFAAPGSSLKVADAAYRLELSKAEVRAIGHLLAERGLVAVRGDRIDLVATGDDRVAVAELSHCYAHDLARVMALLRRLAPGR